MREHRQVADTYAVMLTAACFFLLLCFFFFSLYACVHQHFIEYRRAFLLVCVHFLCSFFFFLPVSSSGVSVSRRATFSSFSQPAAHAAHKQATTRKKNGRLILMIHSNSDFIFCKKESTFLFSPLFGGTFCLQVHLLFLQCHPHTR